MIKISKNELVQDVNLKDLIPILIDNYFLKMNRIAQAVVDTVMNPEYANFIKEKQFNDDVIIELTMDHFNCDRALALLITEEVKPWTARLFLPNNYLKIKGKIKVIIYEYIDMISKHKK